jgi:deoxyribonuclease-1
MRKMLQVWDKEHPVDNWECERAKKIEKIQGNPNNVVKNQCIELKLW